MVTLGLKEFLDGDGAEKTLKLLDDKGNQIKDATVTIKDVSAKVDLGLLGQIEIEVGCKNLVKNDLFSKSDPVVSLFLKSPHTGEFVYKVPSCTND
jgi:hypothetical protein